MPVLDFQFSARHKADVISCDFASLRGSPPGAREHALDLVLRREFYAQGATTGAHLHRDFCALYIVKSGRGAHQIDGIPFGIARGDVYLLPPGALHAYTDYQDLEVDAFYFPLELWSEEELRALREVSGFWQLMLESATRRLHLRPEAHRHVEAAINEMRAEATRNQSVTPFLLRALLFRLLATLARAGSEGAASPLSVVERGAEPSIAELISWCEANVERDISVTALAGRMFLSPAHFARLWKREVGVAPAAYLRRLKLERARFLLEHSTQSVTHIARAVGYESAAHFSRSFRACYGVSARQFRRDAASK